MEESSPNVNCMDRANVRETPHPQDSLMTWICLRFSQMVVQNVFFYHGLSKVTNSTNPREEATGKPTLRPFWVFLETFGEFGDDIRTR